MTKLFNIDRLLPVMINNNEFNDEEKCVNVFTYSRQ